MALRRPAGPTRERPDLILVPMSPRPTGWGRGCAASGGGRRRPGQVPCLCADPAPARAPDGRPVRWAEVARLSGRTMHRLAQFLSSAGGIRGAARPRALGRRGPPEGNLPGEPWGTVQPSVSTPAPPILLACWTATAGCTAAPRSRSWVPRVHPRPADVPGRGAGWTPSPASGPGLPAVRSTTGGSPQLGWTDRTAFLPPVTNLFWPQDQAGA